MQFACNVPDKDFIQNYLNVVTLTLHRENNTKVQKHKYFPSYKLNNDFFRIQNIIKRNDVSFHNEMHSKI